jgi:iron(III) transport system substrate-binding protein
MLVILTGCINRSEEQVTIYCAVDREVASPILDAFQRQHEPLEVSRQFDVESTKSVGLANRILSECDKTRCDVFWNGEILQTLRLERAGLLLKRDWPAAKQLRSNYGSSPYWCSTTARGRILLVNMQKLPDATQWPSKVEDLNDVKWNQNCGFASPLFGSTSTHFAILASTQGESFWTWAEAAKNNAIVLSGNKQVAQAVSSGSIAWGLTDTDDALIEIANGQPVKIVIPDQSADGVGMVLIPSTVAVLANSPHPVAASLLADNLASEETANRLTMAAGAQFNLFANKPFSTHFEEADKLKSMSVDFEKVAQSADETNARLQTIFLSASAK